MKHAQKARNFILEREFALFQPLDGDLIEPTLDRIQNFFVELAMLGAQRLKALVNSRVKAHWRIIFTWEWRWGGLYRDSPARASV